MIETSYSVPEEVSKRTHLNESQYRALYKQALENPEAFWNEQAEKFISWFKPWSKTLSGNFEQTNLEWFFGGKLNACYNCVDRHLAQRGEQVAILWEGNDSQQSLKLTYAELFDQVCRLANVLKKWGIKKGDRVCIYLPMIPEAVIAMLACARIGAIHSVVFAGFSPEAMENRILDADCTALITANVSLRGAKVIPLKENVDR